MKPHAAPSIPQIIVLSPDFRLRARHSAQKPAEPDALFWPEISSCYALENPAPLNPDNRAGRVLSEIGLILGAATALVFVAWAFLPGGTLP